MHFRAEWLEVVPFALNRIWITFGINLPNQRADEVELRVANL